jgi:hypothetical protein
VSASVDKVIDLDPIRIEVVGRDDGGAPNLEAFDAGSLLDDGNEAMAEERYDDAILRYEKLLAVFADSHLAPAAIYNIGLAYEAKGEHVAAISQYQILAKKREVGRDSIDAHLRIGSVFAEIQRWGDARRALQEFLRRSDLTHSDTVEAMARLGYVAVEQKDYAAAEAVLRDAIAYYEKLTGPLDKNYFIAMSYYYLAQIPHRQFRAIPMRLPDAQLKKDLDAKAELVLLAYDRYIDALKIQNVYWATAAGYQLSQIYKEFWDDIVLAPTPKQLSEEAAKYYVQEVHEGVLIFLEKALAGHNKNLELAEAYKTSTSWSEASRARSAEIAAILARESAGQLVTPERKSEQPSGEPLAQRAEYMPARIEL